MTNGGAFENGSRESAWVRRYNVSWDSPSAGAVGSMPIGNGDIGLNVWAEEDGDLLFYIGKTDAWSETGRLLKLGKIRLSLTPNPFLAGRPFLQELDLEDGAIRIEAGEAGSRVRIRLWVDANAPVVYAEMDGDREFEASAALEVWRTETVELTGHALGAANLSRSPVPVFEDGDTVVEGEGPILAWYHRNERSVWPDSLRLQSLEGLLAKGAQDPLLHRTFGGVLRGGGVDGAIEGTAEGASEGGWAKAGDRMLTTSRPSRSAAFSVRVLTAQTASAAAWLEAAEAIPAADRAPERRAAFEAHRAWWRAFWAGSRIDLRGAAPAHDDEAFAVARGYTLQRFMNACGGRGAYPIKFNGSIFTFDVTYDDGFDFSGEFDADYRRWGGGYWFQNTRLPYWSMLASGDFELMTSLFYMFCNNLQLAEERTRRYYGHEGAYFPETMTFWGAYLNPDYGWDREGKPAGQADNSYIRHYMQNNLELLLLMLSHYEYTGDRETFEAASLPVIESCLRFFDRHNPVDERGRLRLEPAQALENWHEAVNPLPEIAGLRVVLSRLLRLPELPAESREAWESLRRRLPDVPEATDEDGEAVFAPAEAYFGDIMNSENVELYAVFPYRIAAVGTPELEKGRRTFDRRRVKGTGGWRQDAIQAAYLGLAEQAREFAAFNYTTPYEAARFPAFWGPNFDWMPDQDHGSVANIALQTMLLQCDGDRILLCPAWPKAWNAEFRLRAPYGTIVEGAVRDGKLERLKVTPEERAKDVEARFGTDQ
ncbi:hypothetical protein FE782_16275 [Paenibacillus antri]|uniref:DUF5703 domain-containing protein n=1 Tax=Paenibacillus antri TaxID=2582848 RepID=A0A5R9GF28_9BACL|nr:DUF5703 domain-containing protein [Paenibacillus antri]TLS51283.1 hypothetical protein FE782_16275 [Paenibacillus antri]